MSRGRKNNSTSSSNTKEKVGPPPSHPQELNREHRAFLIRSLNRNDKELAAMVELNKSLHKVKADILSRYGENLLLDLGEGKIRLSSKAGINVGDQLEIDKDVVLPIESTATTTMTSVLTSKKDNNDNEENNKNNEEGDSSERRHIKVKAICTDFLLRMKLRRKLLNRLFRRVNRLAHAMDGEDVNPPALPKYGDLKFHYKKSDVENFVQRMTIKEEAKSKINSINLEIEKLKQLQQQEQEKLEAAQLAKKEERDQQKDREKDKKEGKDQEESEKKEEYDDAGKKSKQNADENVLPSDEGNEVTKESSTTKTPTDKENKVIKKEDEEQGEGGEKGKDGDDISVERRIKKEEDTKQKEDVSIPKREEKRLSDGDERMKDDEDNTKSESDDMMEQEESTSTNMKIEAKDDNKSSDVETDAKMEDDEEDKEMGSVESNMDIEKDSENMDIEDKKSDNLSNDDIMEDADTMETEGGTSIAEDEEVNSNGNVDDNDKIMDTMTEGTDENEGKSETLGPEQDNDEVMEDKNATKSAEGGEVKSKSPLQPTKAEIPVKSKDTSHAEAQAQAQADQVKSGDQAHEQGPSVDVKENSLPNEEVSKKRNEDKADEKSEADNSDQVNAKIDRVLLDIPFVPKEYYEILKEYADSYEKEYDPVTKKTKYKILSKPQKDEQIELKYGAGIGAVNRAMSLREKEVEKERYQTALLQRIPELPTYQDLGMKHRVFCLEQRRKRARAELEAKQKLLKEKEEKEIKEKQREQENPEEESDSEDQAVQSSTSPKKKRKIKKEEDESDNESGSDGEDDDSSDEDEDEESGKGKGKKRSKNAEESSKNDDDDDDEDDDEDDDDETSTEEKGTKDVKKESKSMDNEEKKNDDFTANDKEKPTASDGKADTDNTKNENEKKEVKQEEKEEETEAVTVKKIKALSFVPIPSFHEQDLKRIQLIHADLMATSMHDHARRRLQEVNNDYQAAFRTSNELSERRNRFQGQMNTFVYEHRAKMSKLKNEFNLKISIARSRWKQRKRDFDEQRLKKIMPSKWGRPPIGTQATQRFLMTRAAGNHGHGSSSSANAGMYQAVGICVADLVDAVILKSQGKIKDEKFDDFVPESVPNFNNFVADQNTGETYGQQQMRVEAQIRKEMSLLASKLHTSEDERKRAWVKLVKTKAEFEYPGGVISGIPGGRKSDTSNFTMLPLPPLNTRPVQSTPKDVSRTSSTGSAAMRSPLGGTYGSSMSTPGAAAPSSSHRRGGGGVDVHHKRGDHSAGGSGSATPNAATSSESKYSAAKVRERIKGDGTVAPVSKPKKTKDGLYQRPAGRTRKGMEWDAVRGIWVPIGTISKFTPTK